MLLKRDFTCKRLFQLTAEVQHFEIFLQFPFPTPPFDLPICL